MLSRPPTLRALVLGGGSIGLRHAENLAAIGLEAVAIVEPDAKRRTELARRWPVFEVWESAVAWRPDFVVVATPPTLHVEGALTAAEAGCHLFIEKPLSHSMEGLSRLRDTVHGAELVSLVGCNMRFHPGPAAVKAILDEGRIGRPLFARLAAGSYLPDWRPDGDYRTTYSARSAMGGGVILDFIHELDLARWYLGDVVDVICRSTRVSDLDLDVEDLAVLACTHQGGWTSEIHVDYVQRSYQRRYEVAGTEGTVQWDFTAAEVRHFEAATGQWAQVPQPPGWQLNQMYVDEMAHFVQCVQEGSPTVCPIEDGMAAMNLALAAKRSARSGSVVRLDEIDRR